MAKGGLNRSISIPQPNIFGRIGSGIGQGLAEQVPKEIERGRMAAGLQQLGQEQNLTPFQQYGRLLSIPGMTPQGIQSGAELLKQQGIAQGFRNTQGQQGENPLRAAAQPQGISQGKQNPQGLQPEPKGLVKPGATQAALTPYIPKTRQELMARAADLYDENRQLYPNPEMAMQAAVQEDQQNQSISNAKQNERTSQIGVEDRLRGQLKTLREAANAEIPDNVFQQVENDIIDKVSNGMPELEAAKEGQIKLDEISRQYKEFDTLGNWTLPFSDPRSTKRSIDSLRQDFKKRNDLENFADSLVGKNGLSYSKAYYKAYSVEDYPEISKEINKLPKLNKEINLRKGYPEEIKNEKDTLAFAKKIAPLIKNSDASPLSIAENIRMLGYDPDTFLDYLVKNKQQIDLSERQGRELNKPRNWFPSINDLWLFIGEGNDKVVEE